MILDAVVWLRSRHGEGSAGHRGRAGVQTQALRATRSFYDAVAVDYAERFRDILAVEPMDRALLAGFAELVHVADGGGPVADLGCGPGRVTAYLHGLGLSVFGLDLSAQMVALARREHPGLRFEQGSMKALDMPDGTLGGIVAWYSIIHVPQERLPEVFAEFHRVLAPGGRLTARCADPPPYLRTSKAWRVALLQAGACKS